MDGATISKLTVDGNIYTANKFAAGLIAQNSGTTNITDCRSSVIIDSTVSGDGTHGGLVAGNGGTLTIERCIFDGSLLGSSTDNCGGFVGWNGSNLTINDSLFAPQEVTIGTNGSATFARNGVNKLNGGYYTQPFKETQDGKTIYELSAPLPEGVTCSDTFLSNGKTYIKPSGTLKYNGYNYEYSITSNATITLNEGRLFANNVELIALTLSTDEAGYYLINDIADLRLLANFLSSGGNTNGTKFKLMNDIKGVDFHIGTEAYKFQGTFDGNGHKITVNYGKEDNRITTDNCALFNYVDGATISKLTVDGNIYTAKKYAAGLIAQNSGTTNITDCRSSVIINSTVSGDGTHGGLVAGNGGTLTIERCIFDGSLLGSSTDNCGGFVGWNGSTLTINDSFFTPQTISIGTNGSATFARNGVNNLNGGYYTQPFNTAQGEQVYALNLPANVEAKLVSGDAVTVGDKTYYESGATFTLTIKQPANKNIRITGIKDLTKNDDGSFNYTIGSPVELVVENVAIGSLGFDTTDNSYTISTETQLVEFRDYVNAGNDCKGLTFKLTKDLDLAKLKDDAGKQLNWTPIGNSSKRFSGTFDGDNHTISNLKITGDDNYQGLFGAVVDGTIKNVSLVNANVSGSENVGGIAGKNDKSTIDNCTVDGSISGKRYVGGIAGYTNGGTIKDNFAATTISGNKPVGGIAGYNNGGTFSGNEYASNVDDDTGAIKWLTLDLPAGITATPYNAAYKVTVGKTADSPGTDYYKPASTFKLTINITSNDDFHKITGIKGLTPNDDGTFDYTIGATLEFEGYAKIGSLAFDGTDTYTINDATDLRALADFVEAGNTCAGYKFKLGANIEGVDFHIGTADSKFAGTLDGDGKSITVNYTATDDKGNYTDGGALFNFVDGATFSKLTVAGTINTSSAYAAGLISRSYGNTTIDNCTSSVTITGTLNGNAGHGGFVSRVEGGKLTIKDSTFDGSFIGQNTYGWGGFVGYNNGDVEITGSLFAPAQNDVDIRQSATFVRNSSNVTDSYCTTTLGTLQGEKIFTALNTPEGVTAEFVSGGTLTIGGTTYYKSGATFKLTVTADDYGNGYEGYTFKAGDKVANLESEGVYNIVLGNSSKVEIVGFSKIGSLGFDRETNTYLISTETQLAQFRDYVNGTGNWKNDSHDCQGYKFKLTANIDLAKLKDGAGKQLDWTPIGNKLNFKGTFDGGNHTIDHLTITDGGNYQGLFDYVEGGTIKNVSLVNANISGDWYVGGIAGENCYGTIDNCTVQGEVSGTGDWVGGIAGRNGSGTIDNCKVDGTISGKNSVGGIAGENCYGTIDNCTVQGEVSGTGDWVGGTSKIVGNKTYCSSGAQFILTLDKTNEDLLANYAKVSGLK